jgi:hypothetical protein
VHGDAAEERLLRAYVERSGFRVRGEEGVFFALLESAET